MIIYVYYIYICSRYIDCDRLTSEKIHMKMQSIRTRFCSSTQLRPTHPTLPSALKRAIDSVAGARGRSRQVAR